MRTLRENSGQASVEMVAALPLVLLAGLIAWQLALAGHTAWLAANAARVAARAAAVGRGPTPPPYLESGLRVERRRGGGVHVTVRVPLLLSAWHGPVGVSATASLGGAR